MTAYFPPAPLLPQTRRHESLRLDVHLCPSGKHTVGWGHNLEANPVQGIPLQLGYRINSEQAERLLVADILIAGNSVQRRWPWTVNLDAARMSVLVNMAFNMGADALAGFKQTLGFVRAGDYTAASEEMLRSDWAKQVGDYAPDSPKGIKMQRPGRAWELSRQMRTGDWWEV